MFNAHEFCNTRKQAINNNHRKPLDVLFDEAIDKMNRQALASKQAANTANTITK